MTPEQFARAIAEEKSSIVEAYFAPNAETAVGQKILQLAQHQTLLREIVDGALTDICYTILLGLDGASSLGSLGQQEFGLFDEEGNRLTGGELEAAAYEVFYGED